MHPRIAPARGTDQTSRLFLKGPIPWWWIVQAGPLPGQALAVGLVLWLFAGMRKTSTIRVASRHLFPELAISRHAIARALRALETAKLVTVERRRGHPPLVSIVRHPPRRGRVLRVVNR